MSHWMLYNLRNGKLSNSEELQAIPKGIHILLVHGRYIGRNRLSHAIYAELENITRKLLPPYCQNIPTGKISRLQETTQAEALLTTASVIACDIELFTENDRDIIILFFAHLRDAYTRQDSKFLYEPLILLLPFWAWDILHDRHLLSVVDYGEYLCWHDANLLTIKEAQPEHDFFRGAGFHAHHEQAHALLPGELSRDYKTALLWLQSQEQGLAKLGENGHTILETCEPDINYLHVLTSFLPAYWLEDTQYKGWTPSTPGQWGGPQVWKDIWELDMRTRQLLMDGWLCLWPDVDTPGKLWLQPASLSLLYWAARYTGQPHTETPQAFLDNYQWDDARWFGGRWKKSRNPIKVNETPDQNSAGEKQRSLDVPNPFSPIPQDRRRRIKLFISYARKDNRDDKKVTTFIQGLQEHFDGSIRYRYDLWVDWAVLIGENWHHEITKALDECHFGLLLVSLPFLNSKYINQHELPKLLDTNRALPVGFQQFKLDSHDLKGLESKQIFKHEDKFYDRCTGHKRSDFIEKLFEQIEKRIDGIQSNT